MIKSFLIKLRQKPRHVRQQVAFGVAIGFTSIVAMFWLTSVPDTVKTISNAAPEGVNAFSSFTDSVNKQIQAAKEAAATRIATTTASTTLPVVNNNVTAVSSTTASTSISTFISTATVPSSIKEVRIATTTPSTSQAIIE